MLLRSHKFSWRFVPLCVCGWRLVDLCCWKLLVFFFQPVSRILLLLSHSSGTVFAQTVIFIAIVIACCTPDEGFLFVFTAMTG